MKKSKESLLRSVYFHNVTASPVKIPRQYYLGAYFNRLILIRTVAYSPLYMMFSIYEFFNGRVGWLRM